MAEVMHQRGPDSSGAWSDDRVAMAHRRLAILDLSDAGAQPMVSASGRFVVVFNGEIYNYRDLSARLSSEGCRMRGSSDTEVLLGAIESWGLDSFLQRADGMFAFALYDRREARLVLARDRFGEKPLVYGIHQGRLYFASDLRAFTRIPGFDLSLDRGATGSYFRYGYVTGRTTIYAQVQRVLPAGVLEVDLDDAAGAKERVYWRAPEWSGSTAGNEVEQEDELLALLSTSVRNRLVSDRPVGAFLSGGIDSSVVSALAAQHTTGALKTFTMGWEDAEYDESRQAARVAAVLGANHHDVRLGRADVVGAVERLGSVMDEPFADSSQLAVLLVSSQARGHVVVSLSGDGGDELFAGYNRHRWLLTTMTIRERFPARLRAEAAGLARRGAPVVQWMTRPIPPTHRPRMIANKVRKLAEVVAAPSLLSSYQALLAQESSVGQPRELAPDVQRALSDGDRDAVLWALRCADLTGYLPDDVLTKVDRATMAVSLESRTPFLQRELVELALRLESRQLLGRSGGKQPLRSLLGRLLPSVSFDQPKSGFGVPMASMLRTELRATLTDAIATHLDRQPPLTIEWSALCHQLDEGDDGPAAILWSLLMFELWAQKTSHTLCWR